MSITRPRKKLLLNDDKLDKIWKVKCTKNDSDFETKNVKKFKTFLYEVGKLDFKIHPKKVRFFLLIHNYLANLSKL